jgi:membrane-associated phospholipid phosphatase
MLRPTPFGAEVIDRRMRTVLPGDDHGTSFAAWLAIQNGDVPGQQSFDGTRRYIRNGRDLGEWVHVDVLFQAYFNACLILGTPPDPSADTGGGIGCPVNPGNPYVGSATQEGFGTWGPPGIKALLCAVASRALKAVWFQKWFVHRRLRPEAFAGRVHVHRSGLASYPLHADVLDSAARARVRAAHGSDLLPLAFPEGSPVHPAYGAGHATVAGACVTILKAFFDESFVVPNPVVPNPGGRQLQPWSGPALTVGGELNKLASNVATGRNQAGVHWRTDAIESLRLGEAVAMAVLEDYKASTHEAGGFFFTSFDGLPVVI